LGCAELLAKLGVRKVYREIRVSAWECAEERTAAIVEHTHGEISTRREAMRSAGVRNKTTA
jgi:hypothetical protein